MALHPKRGWSVPDGGDGARPRRHPPDATRRVRRAIPGRRLRLPRVRLPAFRLQRRRARQLLDIKRQLEDWEAAIAYARSRPELDPDRIIAWGTSFGGGHAILTASRDHRLAAAIAQCPFTDGFVSALTNSPITTARLTTRAVRDLIAGWRGREPVYADTAGKAHSAAFMTSPDSIPGYLKLVRDGTPFRNQLAARFALQIIRHRPGRKAQNIVCPVLFCICETDTVAPAGPTKRYAAQAPRGETSLYPDGHFDIYVGDAFERVVSDQLAFLTRHVPTG